MRPLDAARRVATGIGLREVRQLEREVDSLAEAAGENTALEVPLTARIAELEQALVPLLEHRLRFLADHGW